MRDFMLEYIKHPREIGAIAPSGKKLAEKMMQPIDFTKAKCIVEFGSGTGSFTREIIKRKKEETILILIEQNTTFYDNLMTQFGNIKNTYIINGNAENVRKYLNELNINQVDYIISGLPFTSLPKKISENILKETQKLLTKDGLFLTFQYSLLKKKFFEQYFQFTKRLFVFQNIPPAYVLGMKK